MTEIEQGLAEVQERIRQAQIRSGRMDRIRLIAVTKNHPLAALQEAVKLGVRHVGENRVQEAAEKFAAYEGEPITWHLIGHLQRNKAAEAVRIFDLIHSVDSLRILREIDKQAAKVNKLQEVLLQFNIAEEESKYGWKLAEYEEAIAAVQTCEHIRLRGMMCMAPFFDNPEDARPVFRVAYHVFDDLQRRFGREEIAYLSMGMSNDFEVAIEEGANFVRVGTSIFGARQY